MASVKTRIKNDPVLRGFQKDCVRFGIKKQHVLIADDMGLGKTLEALKIVEYHDKFPVVIVVPSSLKYNWSAEIAKWYDRRYSVYVIEKKEVEKNHDIYIVTYDRARIGIDKSGNVERGSVLSKLIRLNPAVLICDESHYIKNPGALRSSAIKALSKDVDKVILMTGTPFMNRPVELYYQLVVLKQEDVFGCYYSFIYRYCNAYKGQWGIDASGASNTQELGDLLRKNCMIRRTKEEVLHDLPKINHVAIEVPLSNGREYQKAESDFIEWLFTACQDDPRLLESIEGLSSKERSAKSLEYAYERISRAKRAETLVRMSRLKVVAAKGKIAAFMEWINNVVNEYDEKVLCFHAHREIENLMHGKMKFPNVRVVGQQKPKERQRQVDMFQSDPSILVANCSLKAGGVGFNMTGACKAGFLEFPWTPAEMDQAISRAHRIGQDSQVTSYSFVGHNTIDMPTIELIEKKRRSFNQIINGKTADQSQNIFGDLLKTYLRKSGGF